MKKPIWVPQGMFQYGWEPVAKWFLKQEVENFFTVNLKGKASRESNVFFRIWRIWSLARSVLRTEVGSHWRESFWVLPSMLYLRSWLRTVEGTVLSVTQQQGWEAYSGTQGGVHTGVFCKPLKRMWMPISREWVNNEQMIWTYMWLYEKKSQKYNTGQKSPND